MSQHVQIPVRLHRQGLSRLANESGDDAERAELSGTSAVGAVVVVVDALDALDALAAAVVVLRSERGFASQMQRVCRPVLKRFSRHAWHCDRGRPRRLTTSRGPLDPSWCLHVDARWPWMQVAHASFTGGSVGGGGSGVGIRRKARDGAGPDSTPTQGPVKQAEIVLGCCRPACVVPIMHRCQDFRWLYPRDRPIGAPPGPILRHVPVTPPCWPAARARRGDAR